jgi:hypothetical protein
MVTASEERRCRGCAAGIGERHAPDCPGAICWDCGKDRQTCECNRSWQDKRFLFAGALEHVFAFHNRHYVDLGYDFLPAFKEGKLVGLEVNRVGPGAWSVIETSQQARDISDLTFRVPHLSLQTGDDCVHALLNSPLLPQLEVLELGDMERGWGAWMDDDHLFPCDVKDTASLVRLIELAPRLEELYLAADVSEPSKLLAARFPPLLKLLQISPFRPLDLSVLAQNQSLGSLEMLILHEDRDPADVAQTDFHEQFAALVNASGFESIENLRIDMPQLDDACCEALVKSAMLKRLQGLWLEGEGITDAGAATLAASPEVRSLEEVRLGGDGLTEQGYETLLTAGVQILCPGE